MIREKKSLFGPFVALKYLFQKPHTFRFPFEQKPTASRYRGLHINEREKCTGCGNCADICPNQAIRMIEVPEIKPEPGKKNELPQIDYGRCCFCGLCVDICPPGSLSLARDYIHIDHATDSFLYMPDSEKSGDQAFVPASEYSIMKASINHRQAANPGFVYDEDYSLVDFDRVPMPVMKPEERRTSFLEMVQGYAEEEARKEASRCLECALCEEACPANMGISRYVRAIWDADYGEAARVIYETNPLPSICGRICTHRCEEACSIGKRGEPVSIRWLKRFAMDQVSLEDYKKVLGTESLEEKDIKKVAIVGAGPAGLSCAYFLALMGHKSTIFESRSKPGGIPRYGVPEYRMPYDMLDKDIEYIKSLGVEIRCNTRVGRDITLDELHRDYAAVFIATGLHMGRSTRVEGTDHPKVFQALNLLGDITEGKEIMVGKKIVVIGGGNVAMDIARSMARLQMKKYGQVNLTACCLESEDIMPADREEIDESREEGIVIYPARGPDRIEIESGEIKGLHTVECTSVFDEEGRFNPKFNKEDKMFLEGDMIIEAIGQGPDMSFIPEELDEKIEKAGRRIKVDEFFQSSVPWLFFGGDIIQGPDVIHAIVNGHEAAKGIDAYIQGGKRS